jgi:hypothetical protein
MINNEIQPHGVKVFNGLWVGTVIKHIKNQKNYRIIRCIPMKLKEVWTLAVEYEPLYESEIKNYVREWDDIYRSFEFEDGRNVQEAYSMACLVCLRKLD